MKQIRQIELDTKNLGNYYVSVEIDGDELMLVVVNGYEEASAWLNKEQTEALIVNLEDLVGKVK